MKNNALFLDLGPLIAFFAAYFLSGKNMMIAVIVIMIATVIAIGYGFVQTRSIRIMPIITVTLVMVFGGLTLYFDNPVFYKIKPTVVYLLFACALAGGAFMNTWFLKVVFDGAFEAPEQVWKTLTWRWAGFFAGMAALNEFVWRSFSEPVWVNVKVFGFLPLVFLFATLNMPLLMKYMKSNDTEKKDQG